jgi:mannose-1-phosphate guanylyltransferase
MHRRQARKVSEPMDVSAVVLAGTHDWSGSPFESLGPRPLVPVALVPLIWYPLRWLRRGGVQRATICANGSTGAIEDAVGGGAELDLALSYYRDRTPRGAAGCVRDAGLLAGTRTLVVADATAIPTLDLRDVLASHRASSAAVTVVVHRDGSPSAPPAPAGIYVFDRRVLEQVSASGFQDIKENLIPRLHRAGERVLAHEAPSFCPHVFDAQTYLEVNEWMVERAARDARPGRPLVHPAAIIERGARLVGPVQIGPDTCIRSGATVVGPTSIGEGSEVGPHAVVARSVLWDRSVVGEGALVHGCVVGRDGEVPAGATRLHAVTASHPAAPRDLPRRRPIPRAPGPSPSVSMGLA